MFRTIPLSIIRSFLLYTQQWYMSYRFACAVGKPVWHTPLLCVPWKTPDDGQRNCPKHVEFHSKNKFEKLVHLVGFIIRIYQDAARSPERQIMANFVWKYNFNISAFFVLLHELFINATGVYIIKIVLFIKILLFIKIYYSLRLYDSLRLYCSLRFTVH